MRRFLFSFLIFRALLFNAQAQPLRLVTDAELALVRSRIAANGPYTAQGNVCANSPADWTDIQAMRDAFVANPFAAGDGDGDLNLWTPRAGYVPDRSDFYPRKQMENAQAAGLFYALYPTLPYARACGQLAKELLLKQVAVGGWASGSNWPLNTNYYGGSQESAWLVRFCQTLEYVRPLLNGAELNRINTWLDGWGQYLYTRQSARYRAYFPNWDAGDLTTRRSYASGAGETSQPLANRIWSKSTDTNQTLDADGYELRYVGSSRISIIGRFMDNPDDMKADAIFTIGAVRGNATWLRHADTYFKAKLMFWTWPDGTTAEYARNGRKINNLPHPGFGAMNYGGMGLQVLAHIADVQAKNGNLSYYTYSTTDGAHGSECATGQPAKSLLTLATRHAKNVLGQDLLYWKRTSDSRNVIDHKGRYNLRTIGGSAWPYESVGDYVLGSVNRYYSNSTLLAAYTRQGQGYGLNRATAGIAPYNWGGYYSAIVGFSLLHCQMEQLVYRP